MSWSTIHVAAYDDLGAALLDWDDLDGACANGRVPLVDAVLVESADQTIRTLHRFSMRGPARGSASVSVVGLLQPSSLVSGALAGGIGERTIATLAGGLDRGRVKQLGDTMDLGGFTIILITGIPLTGDLAPGGGDGPSVERRAWCRSVASIAVATETSAESIERAVRLDDPLR